MTVPVTRQRQPLAWLASQLFWLRARTSKVAALSPRPTWIWRLLAFHKNISVLSKYCLFTVYTVLTVFCVLIYILWLYKCFDLVAFVWFASLNRRILSSSYTGDGRLFGGNNKMSSLIGWFHRAGPISRAAKFIAKLYLPFWTLYTTWCGKNCWRKV